MDEYITEIKDISNKKVLIYVNDAPSFVLYKNEPDKLGLKCGLIFDEQSKEKVYASLSERALNRALGLIRARDYTAFEIREKLKKEYYPEELIQKTLEKLNDENLLNDRRFVQNYIGWYYQSKSENMIKLALIKKGVEKDIIEEELKSFSKDNPEAQEESINRLLASRYESDITFTDEKEKYKFIQKVYAFLLRKGYPFEKCESAVKNYFDI